MSKTLSVVLATFNEEKNLPGCLDSIKDFADEIIIVDGTSSDKTVEIAKKYGAKVKVTTNKQNFHINKQMAIDMATKDWILQLDADEHISKEQAIEIKEILEKDPKECNGYWMPRKNWFLGRFLMKGGQYPDYTLRFYRKGKGRLPQKDVHEQAVVDGKVGYLKNALLHYPYENLGHYLRKWHRYNKLFAEQIREEQQHKNFILKLFYAFTYLFLKPSHWLFTTFLRHKGFVDGWQGFTFSLFSALRFPFSYIEYLGWYKFAAILILLLAAALRFYNFPSRWGLGGDDARDVMVALEAIKRHELPLVGSFSSAGPFVFGPLFYWFIMASYLVMPFFVNAPWLTLGALGVINVLIMLYLGKVLLDRKFSLILGLLMCLSPQLVVRSLMLGQHTLVFTFASLLILSFVLFIKQKKKIYAFLMGISLGMALSMHYQSLNLLIFFPVIFLVKGISVKEKILSFLVMLFGFLIPSFPLLFWDARQNFANTRNMLDYFLIAQYRIYVPNSWRLYILNFFPNYWSFVTGRYYFIAFLSAIVSMIIFIVLTIKRKLSQDIVFLGFIFAILVFVNRFYKGERSEGYFLYLAPFILIFSGLAIYFLLERKNKLLKSLGIVMFVILILGSLVTIRNLYYPTRAQAVQQEADFLMQTYPGKKFALYDYNFKLYDSGVALSHILSFRNLEDSKGINIGIGCDTPSCSKGAKIIPGSRMELITANKLNGKKWKRINRDGVYDEVIGWSKKSNALTSTFSLKNYIMERIVKIL
jgi:glycosyltransferase involved in cell wall biosynthesis